jgi:hypothetical protein
MILDCLKAQYGGHVRARKPDGKSIQKRTAYYWLVMDRKAELFLKDIEEFVIVKAAQVKLALKFRECVRKPGKRRTEIEIERDAEMASRMRSLNHKGASLH